MDAKLKRLINAVLDNEDETGCDGDLTVTSKKACDGLRIYMEELDAEEQKRVAKGKLLLKRYDVADTMFSNANKELLAIPEESEVVDHEGWESDGEDRLLKKFYYSNPIATEPSLIGSFILEFKPETFIVVDVHTNT